MKVYKLEVMVIDHDELGAKEIASVLENARYPNYCISPKVMATSEAEIGQWEDENPLNNGATQQQEYERLFDL